MKITTLSISHSISHFIETNEILIAAFAAIVASLLCVVITIIGEMLDEKLRYSRWGDIAIFPFIFFSFATWLLTVILLIVVVGTIIARIKIL